MHTFQLNSILIMIVITYYNCDSEENVEETASEYEQYYDDKDVIEDEGTKTIKLIKKESLDEIKSRLCLVAFSHDLNNNTVCSGLNMMLLLGKLALGAKGQTQAELLKAIGVNSTKEIPHQIARLLTHLRHEDGAEIHMNSHMYVNQIYPLKDSYRNRIMEIYSDSVVQLEFNDTPSAAHLIDKWVETLWPRKNKTFVQNFISPDDLKPSTPLVLVGTMFFKGIWEKTFPRKIMRNFTTVGGDIVETELIATRGMFNYTFSDYFNCEIVMLPLNGGKSFYIFVVPNKTDGLELLINNIIHHRDDFVDNLTYMKEEYVQIALPRLGITTNQNIYELAKLLGVNEIFEETADFTDISSKKGVYLSIAKKVIRFVLTEEGKHPPPKRVVKHPQNATLINVVADRPFYFFAIVEGKKILSGICTEPTRLIHHHGHHK